MLQSTVQIVDDNRKDPPNQLMDRGIKKIIIKKLFLLCVECKILVIYQRDDNYAVVGSSSSFAGISGSSSL